MLGQPQADGDGWLPCLHRSPHCVAPLITARHAEVLCRSLVPPWCFRQVNSSTGMSHMSVGAVAFFNGEPFVAQCLWQLGLISCSCRRLNADGLTWPLKSLLNASLLSDIIMPRIIACSPPLPSPLRLPLGCGFTETGEIRS